MTSSIRLDYSNRAVQDIRDILQYTLERWGDEQEERYRQALYDGFHNIRQHPDIGRQAPGRTSNVRELILEHHIIQYRREPERVVILRIVGHRQRRR
jgi:toxin ParE1/3/4